ncbi:antigen 5 like allergen Cul n 1-like [Stomoxys calcitrans]|uniref:Venom allergen-1 n=1 Tax=Stomoxys calcitrans TaxID=35570 RepID=A0A1I8NMK4_STOCA|nr:antigen 5 like allergen Cul n 1-like [Stomoxys calcitrans]XP_013107514.1 antigen 5 like allergen Cul n 1-like [Stomoxys calcitrans]
MNLLVHILSVLILIGIAIASEYCSSSLCSSGSHIACDHSGDFDSSCPSDAAMVEIDSSLKDAIIKYHNEKRNLVAGGEAANHDAACRMATMEWDDKLAYLATLNVRQCKMAHDDCRNTDTFKYAGQNLAWRTFSSEPNYIELANTSMDMWYDEVEHSNMVYINSYPENYDGPDIGHFTVMMNGPNNRLGCAAATYEADDPSKQTFLIACNYARTNVAGLAVYESCSSAGSSCTTGENSEYPNLCSTSEEYDVNDLS